MPVLVVKLAPAALHAAGLAYRHRGLILAGVALVDRWRKNRRNRAAVPAAAPTEG